MPIKEHIDSDLHWTRDQMAKYKYIYTVTFGSNTKERWYLVKHLIFHIFGIFNVCFPNSNLCKGWNLTRE